MISSVSTAHPEFQWTNDPPLPGKRVALLIPQYNEGKDINFEKRLHYFKQLGERYKESIDVILIDDGSTDNSLRKIRDFLAIYPDAFCLASVYPNTQKVGALHLVSKMIEHEFEVLSDFDTDIKGIDNLFESLDLLGNDDRLMGCYFRLIPHDGNGLIFMMQQLEYTFTRVYYNWHRRDRSVPVMPGAGSCYKRKILLEVYKTHSGVRNGEDREAATIGMKIGYKVFYGNDVEALTRTPASLKALVNQRRRWYLGYLETLIKEKAFYFRQLTSLTKMGLRTLQESAAIIILLLLPALVALSLCISPSLTLCLAAVTYLLSISYLYSLLLFFPGECREIRNKQLFVLLLFPPFWIGINTVSWWKAIFLYRDKLRKRKRNAPVTTFGKAHSHPAREVVNE
jgi:cellulose synthase/poly-beta-1,6-N-acetylglucosamine synthase-like glycosyltransferase